MHELRVLPVGLQEPCQGFDACHLRSEGRHELKRTLIMPMSGKGWQPVSGLDTARLCNQVRLEHALRALVALPHPAGAGRAV
jgi:hypothetical protein